MTAMDVFSRFPFAYRTDNRDAKTILKVIISMMTEHAYLPTTFIPDKGSAFVSHVNKEVTGVFEITLKHSTTKQAQRNGLFSRSHASILQAFNIAFSFASRTFAYKRQGLSRSVSAFSSFVREYSDPVVKADQFAQYIDDIGTAAKKSYGPYREHSGSL